MNEWRTVKISEQCLAAAWIMRHVMHCSLIDAGNKLQRQ